MKRIDLALAALLAISSAPALAASNKVTDPNLPRELLAQGPVSVSWSDPAQFRDIRNSPNKWEAQRGNWVHDLAEHMRQEASKALLPGQTLDIRFTDMDRAGEYEPWHGVSADHIRIMKDTYPPRLTFDYTLRNSDGAVLDQGQAKLSDMSYLMSARPMDTDPLRFEKQMIDQWTRRELGDKRQVSSNP